MEPNCDGPFNTAEEWLACSSQWAAPVYDAVLPIIGIAVTIAVLFAGLRVAKKVAREFTA